MNGCKWGTFKNKKDGNVKKEELKSLMEDSLEYAKKLLLRDGKLLPVAFIIYGDNIDIIGLSFRDNEEKDQELVILRKLVRKKNAYAVYVIVESWYVTSNKIDLTIEPSKHPMRKECLFIIGECGEGDVTILKMFDRKNGEIIFGEKTDIGKINSLKFDFGIKDMNKQNKDLRDLS